MMSMVVLGTTAHFVEPEVLAVGNNAIIFKEKISERQTANKEMTEIVVGYSVQAELNTSQEVTGAVNPFYFTSAQASETTIENNMKGTLDGTGLGLIQVYNNMTDSGGLSERVQYAVWPAVGVNMTSGTGRIEYKEKQPDGTMISKVKSFPVTSGQVPVAGTSASFQVEVTSGNEPTGDDDTSTGTISVALVNGSVSGSWKDAFQSPVADVGNGSGGEVEIVLTGSGGNSVTSTTFLCKTGLPFIPKNAKITITYSNKSVTPTTLTTFTPEEAVRIVKNEMINSLTAEKSSTGLGLPYLKFESATDQITAVNGNFKLLANFYKYNAPMRIDWHVESLDESVLTTAELERYVRVPSSSTAGDTIDVQVEYGLEDNIKIKLVGKISFAGQTNDGGPPPSVTGGDYSTEMTLIGTGSTPTLEPISTWYPKNPTNSVSVTEWPSKMEVFDGRTEHPALRLDQTIWDNWGAFKSQGMMSFGKGKGRADYVLIKSTGNGQVDLLQGAAPNGDTVTAEGIRIDNPADPNSSEAGQMTVGFLARKEGAVNLNIEFYNANGLIRPPFQIRITVEDHTPKEDSKLKDLKVHVLPKDGLDGDQADAFQGMYPDGTLNKDTVPTYEFNPDTGEYSLRVGDAVGAVQLTPYYNYESIYPGLDDEYRKIKVTWGTGNEYKINNKEKCGIIPLAPEGTTKITVTTLAEDGSTGTYILNITRSAQSSVSKLKDLTVTRLDTDEIVPLDPEFTPDTAARTFKVTVPFSVKKVRVTAVAEDNWSSKPKIETANGTISTGFLARIFQNSKYEDITLVPYDETDPENVINTTEITVTVKPENPEFPAEVYKIIVTQEGPSHDTTLSSLALQRDKEKIDVALEGNGFQPDNAFLRDYSAYIPYTTESLTLNVQPKDEKAIRVKVQTMWNDNVTEKNYRNKGEPLSFNFPKSSLTQDMELVFRIWVIAEDEWELDDPRRDPEDYYTLTVTRREPNTDARLASLTIVNEADNQPLSEFQFIPTRTDYAFDVPYTTEAVVVTPVPKEASSTAYVNGKKITENIPSQTVRLTSGGVTEIRVNVVPESGEADQITYVIKITRKTPSNDALLIKLDVGGLPFKPDTPQPTLFVPSKTSYRVEIPRGTETVNVTATTNDPNATLTIDGSAAVSGTAFPVASTAATGKITIVVTAEDGKTTKTYTVNYKNWNYMNPSSNADLKSLTVDYGDLSPAFQPNVLDYEMYVKEDAMRVSLTPKTADKNATMVVSQGNRVITEFNDTYAASLLEDESTFTIVVTAEDGITIKTYTITVYRGDEDKMGSLDPILPDMVDFETSDPIVIDITKYPIISAEIFNTLKNDYPDKTILFKGNDYTIELYGGDIDTIVPHTENFDLRFTFTTPDEKEIEDLLDDIGSNGNVDPVYIHFDQHGMLPAPMLLTISLGREYRNDKLYWNYYNKERKRIDYYGYVNTNAKGTLTVPLEHFSTYLITVRKIDGAENKSGLDFGGVPVPIDNVNLEGTSGKANPATGVDGEGNG